MAAAEPVVPAPAVAEEALDPIALAEDLEAALLAALEETPEPAVPTGRSRRLARAESLAAGAAGDAPAAESEYMSMIKSYGPFPLLLPAPRDFRPLLALSVFGGFLGLDRFYTGRPASGALKLVTAGGVGIWWIADIISILTGRTYDRDRRPFTGSKKQRVIASALVVALFGGLGSAAVAATAPAATTAAAAVHEAFFPTPAPVPTWATLADVKGTLVPSALTVTGNRLRFTYDFPGPAYAYLQKVGDAPSSAESLVLSNGAAHGVKEVDVTPGAYQLFVRADGADWTVKVDELGLHG